MLALQQQQQQQAYGNVSRAGLLKVMAKCECPNAFSAIFRQFLIGILARIQDYWEYSQPFSVTLGKKQGCMIMCLRPNSIHHVCCYVYE